MPKISFASTNKGKISTLRRICAPYGIEIVPVHLELPEPQVTDLCAIADAKVRTAYEHTKSPVIAQDSGFFLTAWNGFPGPFVKFALQTLGLDGFLALNKARSMECEFRECLGYLDETMPAPVFFESIVTGTLASEPRGILPVDAWSELHLIFVPKGQTKTVSEMTSEERAEWRLTRGNDSGTKFATWLTARD
jgi:XTP/dITP diphosphohydrolase